MQCFKLREKSCPTFFQSCIFKLNLRQQMEMESNEYTRICAMMYKYALMVKLLSDKKHAEPLSLRTPGPIYSPTNAPTLPAFLHVYLLSGVLSHSGLMRFFLYIKNIHSFSFIFTQLTHAARPTGRYKLPVIERCEMDGIISQNCPRPPLPIIVCQSFKTL